MTLSNHIFCQIKVRAIKRGRFDVRYYYDHLNRLSTRKDNFGNVTQFFYTNHKNPNEVSNVFLCYESPD